MIIHAHSDTSIGRVVHTEEEEIERLFVVTVCCFQSKQTKKGRQKP